jgi:hypothetical protein
VGKAELRSPARCNSADRGRQMTIDELGDIAISMLTKVRNKPVDVVILVRERDGDLMAIATNRKSKKRELLNDALKSL